MVTGNRRNIVDVRRAREIIRQAVPLIGKEQAGVINALGRTLAEDLKAGANMPPYDTAACKGYAAISSDTEGADPNNPKILSILSETSRGKELEPGTVVRVNAGDPLPGGANTVIETGRTFRPEYGPQVMVLGESKPKANINPAGSLISADEIVMHDGCKIGPAEMGIIASLGKPGISVNRRPKVAIITTGARVVDILDKVESGEVRNSARYSLVGMLIECGCDLGRLSHVKEGRIGLERAIKTCGGCEVLIVALDPQDKHDIAMHALANVGEVRFERVLMEPGTNSGFGLIDERPVFIIDRDAALEAFETLIRPGLLTMLGRTAVQRPVFSAKLSATLKPNPSTCHYIKAITEVEDGAWITKPLTPNTPDYRPWMIPNSLVFIPDNVEVVKRGESVDVTMLVPY